ncbi:MAG TPA: hypothetical protein VGJ06_04580 [Candidatus Acidoferrum sp.]
MVYHALGRDQDSDAALGLLIKKYATESANQIAEAYGFRGQRDKNIRVARTSVSATRTAG